MAIYLTLEGVEGPISDPVKKAIELSSVQFGVGCALSREKSKGLRRESEPSLSEITVSKNSDKITTTLFKEVCGGAFWPKGEISITKLIDKKPEVFVKLSLEGVFVSGWSISSGGDTPSESISLAFNKIKVSYNPEDGGKLKGFVDAGWDLLSDKVW